MPIIRSNFDGIMDLRDDDRMIECLVSKRQKPDTVQDYKDCASRIDVSNQQEPDQGKENQHLKEQHLERFCYACNRSLDRSRHFINIAGQNYRWHPECFKCNICRLPLDRETTCHIYKNEVVCREDYAKLRRENSTKCSRCRWTIAASDWVRKAGEFVYHLACFSCDICLRQLSTGEQFTIDLRGKNDTNVRLLCRLHFAIEQSPTDTANESTSLRDKIGNTSSPVAYDFSYGRGSANSQSQYLHLLASTSAHCGATDLHQESSISELPDQSQDIADDTQSVGANPVQQTPNSSSSGSTSGILNSMPSKSKRVRTTFTEDQLSILQTHFQIDSNPDGQDLERIATITGLSKRVTQVWFQNSRARQKKYLIKRKPSGPGALSSAAIGLAGVTELQDHFTTEHQQHTVMTLSADDQSTVVGSYEQKWPTNVSDGSDSSTSDGCAALDDDLEEDSI